MVKIRKQIQNNLKYTFGRGNPRTYLTIHQTDNWSVGANAAAHANLQSRLGIGYSWHWTVDDKEAVQSYDNNVRCWHAGDGRGNGNYSSIAIEICVNSDGNYNKTLDNAAQLAAILLKENSIPISRMVQHNHWSGKNCPSMIRNRGEWGSFVNKVKKYYSGGSTSSTVSSSGGSSKLVVDGLFGPLSVNRLQAYMGTVRDSVITGQVTSSKQYHANINSIRYGGGGSAVVVALQRKLGVSRDGLLGPITIKALQGRLGVSKDGYFGPITARALQTALNNGKF